MVKFYTILFFIITFTSLNAQVAPANNEFRQEEKIYDVVDQKASSNEDLVEFSKKFLSNFDTSHITTASGELLVRLVFVVEKDGSLSNVDIINDTHNLVDQAKKTLLRMPKWKPAKQKGVVVRSRFNFPINIRVGKEK